MSVADEREMQARIDAADKSAGKCGKGHAMAGMNIYKDTLGRKQCWLCRIERSRARVKAPTTGRRLPRKPIDPDVVRTLRRRAGI